jgi:phosphoglycolate phosphatase
MSRPAVIFDLDGTLIDSAPDLTAALNRVLADHGRGPLTLAQVQRMVGEGMPILVERAFAEVGLAVSDADLAAETARYRALYEANSTVHTRPYPGAVDALEMLRAAGTALGLCTNKPQGAALAVLDGLGLAAYFDGVLGGDVVAHRKPDGRHLLEVIEVIGAVREGTVYVGDSETDLAAARDAGVPAILVDFGYSKAPVAELGADAVISEFAELAGALARLGAALGG